MQLAAGSKALKPLAARPARQAVATRAIDDTNFAINLIADASAIAAVTAVITYTSENKDKEIERVQTTEGLIPLGAALAGDVIAHSIPGLNVLFSLLAGKREQPSPS
jgi:hypothetical protein